MSESESPQLREAYSPEERQACDKLLRFLQSKLDSLSPQEVQLLYKQLNETVDEAIRQLKKKLSRMSGLILKDPEECISITLELYHAEDAFRAINHSSIEWGRTDRESKTIKFLSLISFAPKEIIAASSF